MWRNQPILTSTPGIQGLCGLCPDSLPSFVKWKRSGFEHAGTSAVRTHPVFSHPVPLALPSIPPLPCLPGRLPLVAAPLLDPTTPAESPSFAAVGGQSLFPTRTSKEGSKDTQAWPPAPQEGPPVKLLREPGAWLISMPPLPSVPALCQLLQLHTACLTPPRPSHVSTGRHPHPRASCRLGRVVGYKEGSGAPWGKRCCRLTYFR